MGFKISDAQARLSVSLSLLPAHLDLELSAPSLAVCLSSCFPQWQQGTKIWAVSQPQLNVFTSCCGHSCCFFTALKTQIKTFDYDSLAFPAVLTHQLGEFCFSGAKECQIQSHGWKMLLDLLDHAVYVNYQIRQILSLLNVCILLK